jgi:hypothetical protein
VTNAILYAQIRALQQDKNAVDMQDVKKLPGLIAKATHGQTKIVCVNVNVYSQMTGQENGHRYVLTNTYGMEVLLFATAYHALLNCFIARKKVLLLVVMNALKDSLAAEWKGLMPTYVQREYM